MSKADHRQRRRTMNIETQPCALCQLRKPLQQSHVLPEFLYKYVYAGDGKRHRFITVSSSPAEDISLKQTGLKEPLLCLDCEQHIGKWEDYTSGLLYGTSDCWTENQPGRIICSGVDYPKFKLFQMSLIWRAGVAKQKEFEGTSLGPHADRLRAMIRYSDPGAAHEYPCLLMFQGDLFSALQGCMWAPMSFKAAGHTVYLALAGGLLWFFIVSSHSNEYPDVDCAIKPSGEMTILVGNKATSIAIQNQLAEFANWARTKPNAKYLPSWGFE